MEVHYLWLRGVVLLGAVWLAGCSALLPDYRHLKEPRVALSELALTDPNPLAPRFRVRLRVENPNDIDVNLDGADATLELNGRPVATGMTRSPLRLASGSASEVELDVTAQTLSLLELASALLGSNEIRYRVAGHLSALSALGPFGQVPFAFEGTVDSAALLRSR